MTVIQNIGEESFQGRPAGHYRGYCTFRWYSWGHWVAISCCWEDTHLWQCVSAQLVCSNWYFPLNYSSLIQRARGHKTSQCKVFFVVIFCYLPQLTKDSQVQWWIKLNPNVWDMWDAGKGVKEDLHQQCLASLASHQLQHCQQTCLWLLGRCLCLPWRLVQDWVRGTEQQSASLLRPECDWALSRWLLSDRFSISSPSQPCSTHPWPAPAECHCGHQEPLLGASSLCLHSLSQSCWIHSTLVVRRTSSPPSSYSPVYYLHFSIRTEKTSHNQWWTCLFQ